MNLNTDGMTDTDARAVETLADDLRQKHLSDYTRDNPHPHAGGGKRD